MKPFTRITALAAGILALALAACLQTEPGDGGGTESSGISLIGRVVGTGNTPVSGVVVTLARSGVTDTTDALGRYVLSKATSDAGAGAVLDTLRYSKNGQSLARVSVLQWIDTLPDVQVIQRDISGLLQGTGDVSRVQAIVLGDGIDSADPVVTDFYYNILTRNYSGFVYFSPSSTLRNYSVTINIYGPGDLLIGRSQTVPFNSFAGNITIPTFGLGNAVPVAKAGTDTAVALGSTVLLHGTATDSSGGTISKWEWSIGGDAFVQTSTGDTSFSRAAHGAYACILRVTDNDGNQALDTVVASSVATGTSWTTRTSGTTSALTGVAWTGTQFVAVGSNVSLTSPDGIEWTTHNLSGNLSLYSVVWTGKRLIATVSGGSLGAGAYYLSSTDGINWSTVSLPARVGMESGPMIASMIDSVVIIASYSATNRFIGRSNDSGATWFVDTLPQGPTVNGPITGINYFTRHAGLIVGVGNNGLTASSTGNGVWTQNSDMGTFPRPYGGVYDYTMQSIVSTGSHAVAVGYAGHVMRSTDGVNWMVPRIAGGIPAEQVGGTSSGDLYGMTWTGNTLVAVGNGYTVLSADGGDNWVAVQSNTGFMRAVAWNGTRLVAVGYNGKIVSTP